MISSVIEVQRFHHDRWVGVGITDLRAGDVIHHRGQVVRVSSPMYSLGGAPRLRTVPLDAPAASFCLNDNKEGRKWIVYVMDLCNAGLHEFSDDTAFIAELEAGPGYIFSPRLTLSALENFCREHRQTY